MAAQGSTKFLLNVTEEESEATERTGAVVLVASDNASSLSTVTCVELVTSTALWLAPSANKRFSIETYEAPSTVAAGSSSAAVATTRVGLTVKIADGVPSIVIGAAAVPEAVTLNGAYTPELTVTVSPGDVAASTAAWIVQYGVLELSVVESEHDALAALFT